MKIAIYCGSAYGNNKIYEAFSQKLAQELSKREIGIVYGGSCQGLMGIISNEAMRCKNSVIGVIPHSLIDKEVANKNISELITVNDMSERKTKMEELSDAFIALPGGYGTFDEIFEVISAAQLGKHQKPCAFFNINGYYDKLIEFLYSCVNRGFIDKRFVDMLIVSDDINILLEKIMEFKPIQSKWEK